MENRNNSGIHEKLSFFQTSIPRTACTRLQLLLVLTSFVGSLGAAIVLAERPFLNNREAKNNRLSAAWQSISDEALEDITQ